MTTNIEGQGLEHVRSSADEQLIDQARALYAKQAAEARANSLAEQLKIAREALEAAKRMVDEALPGFDWGKSCLSGHQIRLLNETPGIVNQALTAIERGES